MGRQRLRVVLLVVAYAFALTLLEFTYKYLDFVSRNFDISWTAPFVEELTGVFATFCRCFAPNIKPVGP